MKINLFITGCALTILLWSCSTTTEPSDTVPPLKKNLVTHVVQDELTLDVYSDEALITGYNKMVLSLTKNGKELTDAHVFVHCDMDMGSYHHGAPVVQKSDETDFQGAFFFGIAFTMPSTSKWTIVVSVHDHETNKEYDIRIPVSVAESNTTQIISSPTHGNILYVIDTKLWHTGLNEFNLLLFATTDSVSYTPIDNAVVTVNPTMPSMGHGSSGNRNPVSINDGWYYTAVNLIMSGEWDIAFALKSDDGKTSTVHFPIIVQ